MESININSFRRLKPLVVEEVFYVRCVKYDVLICIMRPFVAIDETTIPTGCVLLCTVCLSVFLFTFILDCENWTVHLPVSTNPGSIEAGEKMKGHFSIWLGYASKQCIFMTVKVVLLYQVIVRRYVQGWYIGTCTARTNDRDVFVLSNTQHSPENIVLTEVARVEVTYVCFVWVMLLLSRYFCCFCYLLIVCRVRS